MLFEPFAKNQLFSVFKYLWLAKSWVSGTDLLMEVEKKKLLI